MSDMLELLEGVEKIKTVKPVFSPLSLFSMTEMDTSRLLAFFLDPQGKHGAGTAFLHRFQSLVNNNLGINIPFFTHPSVATECCLGKSGRADILIEEDRYAILIENKLMGANDGKKQLERYRDWLEKHAPSGYAMVYLADHEPSEWSLSSENSYLTDCLTVSPSMFVEKVLDPVEKILNSTKANYAEFTKFSADYLRSISAMKAEPEVEKVIVEHYSSALRISRQIDFVRKKALEQFRRKLAQKLGDDFNVEIFNDWGNRACPEVIVKVKDGQENPWGVGLGFEHSYKDFYYGVRWVRDRRTDEEKQLYETVRAQGVSWGGRNNIPCWSWYVYRKTWNDGVAVIDSPEYIREILKDEDNGFIEWAAEVVKRICEEVREAQEQVKSGFTGCK